MLSFITAGESHGPCLLSVVTGLPYGAPVDLDFVNEELRRRQGGYGRGGRQRIEEDHVEVLSGFWRGVSLGSPVTLQVVNKDYKLERLDDIERPRPGHAPGPGCR